MSQSQKTKDHRPNSRRSKKRERNVSLCTSVVSLLSVVMNKMDGWMDAQPCSETRTRRAHSNIGSVGEDFDESESNCHTSTEHREGSKTFGNEQKDDEYDSQSEIGPTQQRCASIMAKKRKRKRVGDAHSEEIYNGFGKEPSEATSCSPVQRGTSI